MLEEAPSKPCHSRDEILWTIHIQCFYANPQRFNVLGQWPSTIQRYDTRPKLSAIHCRQELYQHGFGTPGA
jgi:hypothetical protein